MSDRESRHTEYCFTRLLQTNIKQIFNHSVSIVEAPMGYGKTTAVRHLLSQEGHRLLLLTAYSSELDDFWFSFSHIMGRLDPSYEERLYSMGFPENIRSLYNVLEVLEEAASTEPLIIVIDDYHLADSPKLSDLINFWIANKIPDLYFIICGRYYNNLHVNELTIKKQVLFIGKDSFELGLEDIKEYYKRCGVFLTNDQADSIYNITEGWVSALYLLMLNYKKTGEIKVLFDIYNLFEHTIFKNYDQKTKDILLTLSIFSQFSSSLAMFIFDDLNTDYLLSQIIKQNAFIRFDPDDNTYYFHHMYKNFLDMKRADLPLNSFDSALAQAARWFLVHDDYVHALDYAYEIKDFELIMTILEKENGKRMNSFHKDKIKAYYSECPQEIRDRHPLAILVILRYMHNFNNRELNKDAYRDILRLKEHYKESDPKLYTTLSSELEVFLCVSNYNNIKKMGPHIIKACELLSENSYAYNNKQPYTFGHPSILHQYHKTAGELDTVTSDMEYYGAYYDIATDGHGQGAYETMMAEKAYYRCELNECEIALFHSYSVNPNEASGILLCNILLNIRLCMAKGDYDQAVSLFDKAKNIYQKYNYIFIHTIDLCEAVFYSLLGAFDKIQPWILKGDFNESFLFFPAESISKIIHTQLLLYGGKYLEVIGYSKNILELLSVFDNVIGYVDMYIFLSAAYKNTGKNNLAMEYLTKALDLAIPDRLYMPFVENYKFINEILLLCLNYPQYKQPVEKIFEYAKKYEGAAFMLLNSMQSSLEPSSLTARETDVAVLAAQGHSNKQVAEKLFVSENTVKTHLKNIYSKLNVNSRSLLKYKLESLT